MRSIKRSKDQYKFNQNIADQEVHKIFTNINFAI